MNRSSAAGEEESAFAASRSVGIAWGPESSLVTNGSLIVYAGHSLYVECCRCLRNVAGTNRSTRRFLSAHRWATTMAASIVLLRNVYGKSSAMAASIRGTMQGRQKLLLTATPLQNSLMELYSLASVARTAHL